MKQFAGFSCLVGLVVLAGTGVVPAQPLPADPVETLRQALKMPAHDLPARAQAVQQALEELRGIGELRRALALQEWRDEDIDSQVAGVDHPQRAALQGRFEEAVRGVIAHGTAATQS